MTNIDPDIVMDPVASLTSASRCGYRSQMEYFSPYATHSFGNANSGVTSFQRMTVDPNITGHVQEQHVEGSFWCDNHGLEDHFAQNPTFANPMIGDSKFGRVVGFDSSCDHHSLAHDLPLHYRTHDTQHDPYPTPDEGVLDDGENEGSTDHNIIGVTQNNSTLFIGENEHETPPVGNYHRYMSYDAESVSPVENQPLAFSIETGNESDSESNPETNNARRISPRQRRTAPRSRVRNGRISKTTRSAATKKRDSRKRHPECDPENQIIKHLRTENRLSWEDIAAVLNTRRARDGKSPGFSVAAVYGRFVRNAPKIAEAAGQKDFDSSDWMHLRNKRRRAPRSNLPAKQRINQENSNGIAQQHSHHILHNGFDHGNIQGYADFTEQDDALLIQAYSETSQILWELVAENLSQKTGKTFDAQGCAERFPMLT